MLYMKTFRERLNHAMQSSGHNQSSLARACGLTRGAINQWSTGRVTHIRGDSLLLAAQTLHVSPEWLRNGAPRKKNVLQAEQELASYQVGLGGAFAAGQMAAVSPKARRLIQQIIDMEHNGQLAQRQITMLQNILDAFQKK